MKFVRENSLSLFFLGLFGAALVGQAFAGHALFNDEQIQHGGHAVSTWDYVTSASFGNAVLENWQSEYLQFMLPMLAAVYLVQRGSPESKPLDRAGRESDQQQRVGRFARPDSPAWARIGGLRQWAYSNSLLIVMALIFFGSWLGQSLTGHSEFNSEQALHGDPAVSWLDYIGSASFWEATLQNWQSEFLAVGSFAVLAIFLRQRGSPESKPVGAPHDATGVEG